MRGWTGVLVLGGVTLAVIIFWGSRFNSASVSIGDEGPTVTPSNNNQSSAGNP